MHYDKHKSDGVDYMKYKQQIIMLLAVLFWSGAFIAGKYTANVIDPVTVTFLRFLIASVILTVYIKSQGIEWKLTKMLLQRSLILAVVGMLGYHLFFYKALESTTAIHASLIASTNPFFTYVLSIIFLKSQLKAKKFIYIFMALIGVALIVIDWNFANLIQGGINPGDLIMIVAVMCWASYSILVKRYITEFNPMIMTTTVFIITTVLLAPFADYTIVMRLFSYRPEIIASVVYMGIFPTVFGYMIQQYSIKAIGPEKTNIFINLVPVFTVGLSIVLLGETLNLLNLLAGIVVVGSVYRFNRVR
jgi:drug/metabolite transporter (DMT)-like permease